MRKLDNYTEEQILEIIKNISGKLSRKFKFAFYESEDIGQEIFIEVVKGLENYDGKRPLENFLFVHVKNRLINLKRNKYERPGKPCEKCEFYDLYCKKSQNQCTMFENREDCELYAGWLKRNSAKKNIISPIDIYVINDENEQNTKLESNIHEDLNVREMLDTIDVELPVALREDYIKLRDGIKIPKNRRDKVQEAVLSILEKNNLNG